MKYVIRFLPTCYWTCSFMCHFNSTESMHSSSHFGALNLSYTSPYQVLIFTWVKWSIWVLIALPKDTTSKHCPNIERGETWYISENRAPSGIQNRTAGSVIDKAPRSNHCATSLNIYYTFLEVECGVPALGWPTWWINSRGVRRRSAMRPIPAIGPRYTW